MQRNARAVREITTTHQEHQRYTTKMSLSLFPICSFPDILSFRFVLSTCILPIHKHTLRFAEAVLLLYEICCREYSHSPCMPPFGPIGPPGSPKFGGTFGCLWQINFSARCVPTDPHKTSSDPILKPIPCWYLITRPIF